MEDRKLGFWQIAKGRFAKEVQPNFEKAQKLAIERGLPVTLKMEITVLPPTKQDPTIARLTFKHSMAEPSVKSKIYDHVLRSDVVVCDAEDAEDFEQTDLLRLPSHSKPSLAVAGGKGN